MLRSPTGKPRTSWTAIRASACLLVAAAPFTAAAQELSWPPRLPGGAVAVTDTSPAMLRPPPTLPDGVEVAETPPRVDFMYYPRQDAPARLWSAWGESLATDGFCYSAIGDHDGPLGNAFLYEYDDAEGSLRAVVDLQDVLGVAPGDYTPGKIHSRIDLGRDGWLYFSTHRGSTRVTTPENGFRGGWIVRYHPERQVSEVVAHAPVPGHTLPTSLLDPDRMIFYAGTQDGANEVEPKFLAYDIARREPILIAAGGPARCILFAQSTGRIYFHQGKGSGPRPLVCFDPSAPGGLRETSAVLGARAVTVESEDGKIYTIENDRLWAFDTASETVEELASPVAGQRTYTTSLDLDRATQRYLYYVPGAHGGAEADGAPLVQYDLRRQTRKVIAFLHPFYAEQYGYTCGGAYGTAVSPDGRRVYVTWNGARDAPPNQRRVRWNTCAFTVVHIPESERRP